MRLDSGLPEDRVLRDARVLRDERVLVSTWSGDERVDVGEGEREAFAVDVVAVLVVCERSESGGGRREGRPGQGDVPKPVTGRVASVHFQTRRRVVAADASGDARRRRSGIATGGPDAFTRGRA